MLFTTEHINTQDIPFRERLKNQTAGAHNNLEKLPLSLAITSPDLKLPEYAGYLNKMFDVMLQAEEDIFPVLNRHFAQLVSRQKSHLIAKDLAYIQYPVLPGEKPFGSTIGFTAAFSSGILYVVEGSILGGRYILGNIKNTLQLDEKNGASYFNGYGAATSSSWKQFVGELITLERECDCGEEIIAGANFAFEAITQHMSEYTQL